MDRKTEITKQVLSIIDPDFNEQALRTAINSWWQDQRRTEKGGLRLTRQGRNHFRAAKIKEYRIRYDRPIYINNQLILRLHRHIDGPFYLDDEWILVYTQRLAVELVMFSGDVQKYAAAKDRKSA